MRFLFVLCVSLAGVTLGLGSDAHAAVAANAPSQVASLEAILQGGEAERAAMRLDAREALFGNVAHYRLKLRVGPGEHDFVTLHRVVREDAPWRPSRSNRAVFMVHGDGWGFEAAFLSSVGSAYVPADHSIAAYLAKEGVDVWGIDLRWAGVPTQTQDFSFMANWTLETHARDVGVGLAVARALRLATGSGGNGSMHLMGWSRGAAVAYVYMNLEAQLPRGLRQVDGFIPMDMVVRYSPADADLKAHACERYAALSAARQAGRVEGGLLGPAPGITLQAIGQLAALLPGAPTPLLPEDVFGPGTGKPTNRKVAIVSAAATGLLMAPLKPLAPDYHLMAAQPDALGLPETLTFTNEGYLFEYAQRAAPYQSLNEVVETEAWACGQAVPYDDFLNKVNVPVLYVGAAGGVGRYGEYSLTQLGSHDVTVLIARTLPESARARDFGHADLFLANDARERVWKPVLQWVKAH
ncbi:hypothetical protein JY651_22190 [Pyxidicoccus parkwayensis]|uniref:Lipoprotein n=1 Tax=Pyxidicoccus parkwayensis TaxID=2813578 RepID=A0ABX7PAG7_9BACT|nr:hypothetical protein [Pyxidicoccus parkwaysis]QSQ27453.1 hypothetical protein JY651_22190 [Pyxidicoccus parkwaysis]